MWSSTLFLLAHVFVILFHMSIEILKSFFWLSRLAAFFLNRAIASQLPPHTLMPMAFYIPEFRLLTLAVGDLLPSFLPEPLASFLLLSKQLLVTYAGHSYAYLCLGVSLQGLFWAFTVIWGVICVPNHNRAPDSWTAALKAISCYFCLQSYAFVVVLVISFSFPISEVKFPERTLLSFCLWREVDEVSIQTSAPRLGSPVLFCLSFGSLF